MVREKDLPAIIRDVLDTRTPRVIQDKQTLHRHAAVLIPLFKTHDGYSLLFTKRTNMVEEHKGQISFPGGSVDEGDGSFQETALREAYEEIGLRKEDVVVLGRVDDALTLASNFVIHPFVGLIPHPYRFRLNKEEVKRLIEVPLEVFLVEGSADRMGDVRYGGETYHSLVFPYDNDVIWGATARIMENFVEILGERLSRNEKTVTKVIDHFESIKA